MTDDLFRTLGGEPFPMPKARGRHYCQPRGYHGTPGAGPKGETCGTCEHHVKKRLSKVYHKCELAAARWTGGRATDILVRAPACQHWKEKDPTHDDDCQDLRQSVAALDRRRRPSGDD